MSGKEVGHIAAHEATILVIDVQNDFCHPHGAFWQKRPMVTEIDFERVIEKIQYVIDEVRARGVDVIFTRTIHSEWTDSPTWKLRHTYDDANPICLYNSWGAEFYRISPRQGDLVVTKNRYSAFLGTNLDIVLRSRGKRSLILVGFMANVCVESTARDAFQLNYLVYLLEDCLGAASKVELESALSNTSKYFGWVLNSQSLLTLLT